MCTAPIPRTQGKCGIFLICKYKHLAPNKERVQIRHNGTSKRKRIVGAICSFLVIMVITGMVAAIMMHFGLLRQSKFGFSQSRS